MTVLATALPEMVPIIPLTATETLAGPPLSFPKRALARSTKNCGSAAGLVKGPKGDEKIDEIGRDPHRDTKQPVFGHKKRGGDSLQIIAPVGKGRGQMLPEKGIGQKSKGDDEQGPSHHAAGQLKDQHNTDDTKKHIPIGRITNTKDKLPVIKIDIDRERKTEHCQYEINNKKGQGARSLWIEGIMNKAHGKGKREEKA